MKKYIFTMGNENDSALFIAKMKEVFGDEIVDLTPKRQRKIKRIKMFLSLVWRLNYYKGIDKLTFLDRLYKRRLSAKTAWDVAKIIYD